MLSGGKLNLILGSSGSGKSFYIKQKIKEFCSNEDTKIMLIIPEQYSFETEKSMLEFLGAKNANNIIVTSFKRLVDFAFRQIGGFAGDRLNDSGRNVFMNLAIDSVKESLKVYADETNNNEIVDIMISALKEFKINSISTKSLLEISHKVKDKTLRMKAKDTALILEAYDALVEQSYLEPLDDLTRLSEKLGNNDLFGGYRIFIDEFDGFTPQEMSVLKYMLKQCEESYIALRVDELKLDDNGMNLFSPVHKTVKQLIDLSNRNGIYVDEPLMLDGQPRFRSEELKVLEKNLFRKKIKSVEKKPNNVFVYSANNVYDEINFVANTIKKMIIEDGYCYNDFAVIARTLNDYKGVIDSIFEKHSISYFLDIQQNIEAKPIMNMVLTLFEIIHSSFDSEFIFKYLKTGIPNIEPEDISIIENYVMLWIIDNKDWLIDFKYNPSGFYSKMSESDNELLAKINDIRKRIITPILKFSEKIKSNKAGDITKALYDFLLDVEADKRVSKLSEELKRVAENTLAEEQLRLWDLLMDILDQIYLVLKGRYIKSKKYHEILKLVIMSEKIAFIPQTLDEVIVGDADRIRLKDKKVVFIIGAVEGQFPRNPVPSGVFSDSERKLLISLGLPMYESLEKLVIEERFLAYISMMSPSDKLFLSFPKSSILGESNYPSSIITGTKKVFPYLHYEDEYSLNHDYSAYSERPTFELCAKNWNNKSSFAQSLKYYFEDREEYKAKMKALYRASELKPFKFDDINKAEKFFGSEMVLSSSQVEKFYLCKFQYFCKYGLLAKEQKPYVFNSLEYGKLTHFLLESILSSNSIESIKNMSKSEMKSIIDDALEFYIKENLGGLKDKTERFKYLLYRVSSVLQILLEHIRKEFSQSEFVPTDFEVDISQRGDIEPLTLRTTNGDTVKIQGKIDRIDVMQKDGKSYVRVVDYKTGTKDFNLSDVVYGLNAQMFIYLSAICQDSRSKYKDVIPAGILYMPCNKPLINADRNIKEDKLNAEISKKLRMNGLILDNPEVIKSMEKDAKGIFIPVLLKDGELKKFDSVASLAQMGRIMKHLEKLIVSMSETLKKGDISANPAVGEYNACEYCEYKSVCGHEDKSVGRAVEKLDRDAAMDMIEKSVGEKDV